MLELNFNPFPELRSERLLLRRLLHSDAPAIFNLRSDLKVLHYIHREPAQTIAEAEEFIQNINKNIDQNDSILWGITLKEDPSSVIGTICFWNIRKENYRAEIGYALIPSFWNKGIIKEAIQSIMEYGFGAMNLHSVDANINPENIASGAVLEANGFIKEAHFKEDLYHDGKFYDTIVYSKLNK